MSHSALPLEFTPSYTAKEIPLANMNTVCEALQFFPSLEGHSTTTPTFEEIEQLSFFDQWLVNDYQGSNSSEELISTIDDFEIIPYGDSVCTPCENISAFNVPMIDSSMFSEFPSQANLSQFDLLSDFSSEVNSLTPCEDMMSPIYNHLDNHSPVNIQLPSPAQTPRLSSFSFKDISFPSHSNDEMVGFGMGSNKHPHSEDMPEQAIEKRKRNTDAARRSRQRKVQRLNELDKRSSELLMENSRLSTKVAVLESEKEHQRQKELELQVRIQTLENQLAEAHRILAEL